MSCKCALYRVHTLHSRLTSAVTAGCPSKMQLPVSTLATYKERHKLPSVAQG